MENIVVGQYDASDHSPVKAVFPMEFGNRTYPSRIKRDAFDSSRVRKDITSYSAWVNDTFKVENVSAFAVKNAIWDYCKSNGFTSTSKPSKTRWRFSPSTFRAIRCRASLAPTKLDNPEEYKRAVKKVKDSVKADKRKHKIRWLKAGIRFYAEANTRVLWKWIRGSGNINKFGVLDTAIRNVEGELKCSSGDKVKIFTEHYSRIYKDHLGLSRNREHWNMVYPISRPAIPECTLDLTWSEIVSVLTTLRKGKSSGNDGVPSEVYKSLVLDPECVTPMSIAIYSLLSKVYTSGDIPKEWDHSILVPVPKKGDPRNVDSYRPIALINTLLKILCKVVANRINLLVDKHNLLSIFQSGFRTREECVAQATTLLECLQRRSRVGKPTLVCFLDFAKAYDSVPHEGLMKRLESLGFGDRMLEFIRGLYKNPSMKVKLTDEIGPIFNVEVGVRQGCPLSPMLFNLYINDLFENMVGIAVPGINTSIPGLMFTDDTTLLADNLVDLNRNIRLLEKWCTSRGMRINAAKCGLMYINCTEGEPISIFGESVPVVDSYQYLL